MAKKWCKGNLPAWRARKMAQARDVLVLCWLGSFNRGNHAIGPSTRLAESARRPTRPSSSPTTTAATRALKSSPSLVDCLSRPFQLTPHRTAMARTKVSTHLIFDIGPFVVDNVADDAPDSKLPASPLVVSIDFSSFLTLVAPLKYRY